MLFYSVVVVVIFQNYNLSKRFESLITRRDKIRFFLEKLIIRHVFTCLSKLIIISYIYIYIYFPQFILLKKKMKKMIPEFQKVWNHVQIYIHCSIAK